MAKREEFIRKMHSRLDKVNHEIDDLLARKDRITTAAYAEYMSHIGDLKQRREELLAGVRRFEESSESALEDLKCGMESAWEILSQALSSARGKFK